MPALPVRSGGLSEAFIIRNSGRVESRRDDINIGKNASLDQNPEGVTLEKQRLAIHYKIQTGLSVLSSQRPS
jgi:hypothetical protein